MIEAVLTIDDISSENTRAIVDFLCEKGIMAVMFAVGRNVEKFYENAVYAVKRGMIAGNHSYTHPAFHEISMEEAVEEIEKNEELLKRLYDDAGVERKYKLFRFPYGDKGGERKEALQRYLRETGFVKLRDSQITYPWYEQFGMHEDVDTFWTFDFAEWKIRGESGFGKEDVFRKMEDPNPVEGAPLFAENAKHILLLHAHDETEKRVPEYYKLFLEYAMEKGVRFTAPRFNAAYG